MARMHASTGNYFVKSELSMPIDLGMAYCRRASFLEIKMVEGAYINPTISRPDLKSQIKARGG